MMKAMSALRTVLIAVTVATIAFTAGGCGTRNFWNPFVWHAWLDPTRTISVSNDSHATVDIQHQVDDREQYWDVFPNAEPPTLEDLQPQEQDYVISPGDELDITVMDLYMENSEALLRRRVSNEGTIHMPYIGKVSAGGKSIMELTELLVRSYSPEYLLDPVINITTNMQLENLYSITGAVNVPQRFTIPRPEYRLLDAIAMARGITDPSLEYIYVFRQVGQADSSTPDDTNITPSENINTIKDVDALPALPGEKPALQDNTPEKTESEDSDNSSLLDQLQQFMPEATEQENQGNNNSDSVDAELPSEEKKTPSVKPAAIEPVVKDSVQENPAPAKPATAVVDDADDLLSDLQNNAPVAAKEPQAQADNDSELDDLKNLMGQPQSKPATRPIKPTEMLSYSSETPAAGMDPDDPFGWAQQDISKMTRIIVIDLNRLKMGDPSQNIIIRNGDVIQVPPHKEGVFFVGGDVNQVGMYNLTGRKITIKMAIHQARGFNAMAWPSNSVLVRRLDDNRELRIPLRLDKIMAGQAPEILLRPDDQIMVGSHLFSPFLAVLRNSFRFTYGMGFIFERNFADVNFGQYNEFDSFFR